MSSYQIKSCDLNSSKSVMPVFLGLTITIVLVIICYTQLTIFVIPPIGAIPEGRTLIISRLNKTDFIDSPDAMCDRSQGGVSLLCRGILMGAVLDKSTIYVKMPYSNFLYLLSTGGKTFEK